MALSPFGAAGTKNAAFFLSSSSGCWRLQVLAEVKVAAPRIPVYSNVTAAPLASAGDVTALLARQLVEPVQWEGTLKARSPALSPSSAACCAGQCPTPIRGTSLPAHFHYW